MKHESVMERLKGKTLDQIGIDDLHDLIQELIDKKINKKRKPYSIEIKENEKEQAILEAITAAIRGNKRPTIKAMLGRKHILKRLDTTEFNGLIQKLVNDNWIYIDETKRKPAYYHQVGRW